MGGNLSSVRPSSRYWHQILSCFPLFSGKDFRERNKLTRRENLWDHHKAWFDSRLTLGIPMDSWRSNHSRMKKKVGDFSISSLCNGMVCWSNKKGCIACICKHISKAQKKERKPSGCKSLGKWSRSLLSILYMLNPLCSFYLLGVPSTRKSPIAVIIKDLHPSFLPFVTPSPTLYSTDALFKHSRDCLYLVKPDNSASKQSWKGGWTLLLCCTLENEV